MRKNLLGLLLVFTFLLPTVSFAQTAVKIDEKERKMAEAITAAQLKDYLYYVASDEMAGRDTPSQGLDLTAKFIGTLLSRWGFRPAGDNGTFFQKIDLHRDILSVASTTATLGGQNLVYGTDFFANPTAASLSSVPMVFVGEGWMIKSKGIDPYKDLDVRGKIVVTYSSNFPRGVNAQEIFSSGKRGEAWADPVTYARQNGAVAVIGIATPDIEQNWQRIRTSRERSNYSVDKLQEEGSRPFPTIFISSKAAENLFKGESSEFAKIAEAYKSSAALPSFNFSADKTASFSVVTTPEKATTQNIVAVWEGADTSLKNEYVAIGAHYDHVGTNPNARGDDKIWNGADDDGSGTVAVLSIAEALAKAPKRPKRSTLFVWHCGEEKGLWGSEYFNKFPTVDVKQVVTQLNIDMIGRSLDPNNIIKCGQGKPCNEELSGPNGVYVIGSEMMSSTLGAITKGTNDAYLKLGYDYKYDDPKDKNRFFFRSDHFNYAQNGIPIVFWFDGVHEDYHQPGDEPQKIDYAKMEKITRTIYLTLLEVSDLKERPKIDKQLPPELTRK
ncbi:MAG TPA: M28 family peptidase [Pyrinomonadaceae bacterium]|jgi:Zn-dependent M28 family amino/carboxypeptidase